MHTSTELGYQRKGEDAIGDLIVAMEETGQDEDQEKSLSLRDPMSVINRSDSNAARRLLQLQYVPYALNSTSKETMTDFSRLFQRYPDHSTNLNFRPLA